ncbi:hypothetical protein HMPREF2985_05365 [Corynebacterium sp. HMSC072B09]|uniref:DUF2339 domain-containing protein n=1 Tax=unclassified Corynebacterium TaxID=2624378 RepID=UPI0008AA2CB8|nr:MULTISPECIES: DUF2339 domain-containing protein [unclassified Corynebacterium]OHR27678.1 hypothetical protein HMPREF2849_06375 [Corynebacterium sp. HMSC073B01]OHR29865.1 hypothetical protein HMPREF2985_05365 [Corynebacterium sp. HMSC072B09]
MNTGSNGFGPKAENTNPNQHSARYGKPPTGDFVLTGDSVSELSHALADLEASSLRLAQLTRTWQVRLSQASEHAPAVPHAPQGAPQAPPHAAPQGAHQHSPQPPPASTPPLDQAPPPRWESQAEQMLATPQYPQQPQQMQVPPPPAQADWRNQPAPLPQSEAAAQPMFDFPSAHQWRRDSKMPQSSPTDSTPPPKLPEAPREPREPWWRNEKAIIRIIAIFGGLITAAGIAFFVAVAIQSGLIGPAGRVILAYLLAAVLAVAAVRAHRRQAPPAGVTALIATSLAAAHLTTMSMSYLLDWIPVAATLFIMLPLAAVGLYGARWTKSSATAAWTITINTGLMLWATIGLNFHARPLSSSLAQITLQLMVIAAIACLLNVPFRKYVVAFLLGANVLIGVITTNNALVIPAIAALTIALFAFAQFGPLAMARQLTPELDDEPSETSTWEDDLVTITSVVAFSTPVVAAVPTVNATQSTSSLWLLFYGGFVLFIAIAAVFLWNRAIFRYLAPLALATAILPWLALAVAGPERSSGADTGPHTWGLIPISIGAALFVWALATAPKHGAIGARLQAPEPTRDAVAPYTKIAALTWLLGATVVHLYILPAALNAGAADDYSATWAEMLSLLFLLCADVGLAVTAARSQLPPAFALIGLAALGMPFIVLLTTIGVSFNAAHMLLSIFWATIAGMLVLSKRFHHIPARLAAGLTIAALSIVKLIFYDMATLDGVIRALAFLGCGLILLAMAVSGAKQKSAEEPAAPDRDGTASNTDAAGASGAADADPAADRMEGITRTDGPEISDGNDPTT